MPELELEPVQVLCTFTQAHPEQQDISSPPPPPLQSVAPPLQSMRAAGGTGAHWSTVYCLDPLKPTADRCSEVRWLQ